MNTNKKGALSQGAISELFQGVVIAKGYTITAVTQRIDHSLSPTDLSQWMDTVGGHTGGWYHRLKHGHDFAANAGPVYKKFGAKGLAQYPFEIARDATTPHGVPIPGTEYLVTSGRVPVEAAANWLSLNAGDCLTGGVALYTTYKFYKKTKNGLVDDKTVIWATIGIAIKIGTGFATTNPILLLSAGADTCLLIRNYEQAKEAFKHVFHYSYSQSKRVCQRARQSHSFRKGLISSCGGTVVGAGTALGTTTIIGAFGTASTGTAIASLSGAAATKATFAAIGGGALAAGGLGATGGIIVLTGGAALVAAAVGFGSYRLWNQFS